MELDDAYANAAHIKGAERFPGLWAAKAEAFRDSLGARAEIGCRYGDTERQTYDLFHPEGTSKGTVLFIHGGYWLKFDRSYWSHLASGCLSRGWSVAMPSYDLCPQVRLLKSRARLRWQCRPLPKNRPAPWRSPGILLVGIWLRGCLIQNYSPRILQTAFLQWHQYRRCQI